jgi:thiamine-monophosphate kinase
VNPTARDEAAWIRRIRALWGPSGAEVELGDDACVLPAGRHALTTDTLVEHVDFERAWAPPQALGYKALAVNLSDLASMGAEPLSFLLTMGWPKGFEEAFVEGVLQGMYLLSKAEGIPICGGDLTESPGGLLITITAVGLQEDKPLLRSGGRPEDLLFVSGALGGPAEALRLFQSGKHLIAFDPAASPADPEQHLLDRFFRPPSQTRLGRFLARRKLATACIDISDGFARDLGRLCEASGCGAVVGSERLPVEPTSDGSGTLQSLRAALRGGEEQILLFAAPPERVEELREAPVPVHRIGRLTKAHERILVDPDGRRETIPDEGFDHFLA